MKLKTRIKVLIVKTCGDRTDYTNLLSGDRYLWQLSDSAAALELCLQEIPDCILLNWESPEELGDLIGRLPDKIPLLILGEVAEIGSDEDGDIKINGLNYLVKSTLTPELLDYAIRNAISQARLKQKLELTIGLNTLIQTIHNTSDLSTIFSAAKTVIAKSLQLEYVEIGQLETGRDLAKTWIPFPDNPELPSNLLNLDSSIDLRLQQGEILSVNSVAAPESNIEEIRTENICLGPWLLVPLVLDVVWGAIFINGQNPKSYWQDFEIDLVINIANQLGVAIAQSQAQAQIQAELAERRRAEIDLYQSEQLYATLADSSPVGIYRTNIDGNCLYVNERWSQITGINFDRALGKGWVEAIYIEDRQLVFREWQESVADKRPFSLEYRFQNAEGKITWIYGQAEAERGINGNIVGFVGSVTDISDRIQAERALQELNESLETKVKERTQALRESEAKFRYLVEGGVDLVWRGDLKGTLTYLSPQFKRLFGWNLEEYIGKSFTALVHPEDRSKIGAQIQQIIATGKQATDIEFRHLCQDGSYIWVTTNPIPIFDKYEAKVIALQGILQDISQRKLIEDQLLASKQELEQFFNMDLDLLCIADINGYFLRLNHAWESTLGYPLSELEGQLFLQFVHPDDISATMEAIAKLEDRQEVAKFTNRYRCKDGSYRYIEWYSRPFGNKIYASAHDITTQRHTIELLSISEQKLRIAQRVAHVGSWEYNIVTQKISWSEEIFNIYGVTASEPTYPEYLQLLHPEDREKLNALVCQAILSGTSFEIEHRIFRQDGIRWVLGRGEVEQANGQTIRIFGTASDITIAKESAIALAQAKEAAEAGTKAKSEFLASMSHEIRTPMNGVLGMAELLSGTNLNTEQQELVQTIRDSGNALLTVINDILDFSKIEAGMLELEEHVFVLADILKSICRLLSPSAIDKGIMLQCTIHPDTPTTFIGDSSRLRQVLLNLVANAVKFTKQGQIKVSICSRTLENQDRYQDRKHELLVTVSDTGIGINGDRLSKLFQPFTQADTAISRKYGGTGLGLAICKRLLELMDGTIWVESFGKIGGYPPIDWLGDVTKGSTFYFTVKVEVDTLLKNDNHSSNPNRDGKLAVGSEVSVSNLRILVAEDNLVNQKVIGRILKRLGYDLDIVLNGIEVLEALTKNEYDLILMDMQMPEMDGLEATRHICHLYPDNVRPYIIAMTANVLQSDRAACFAAGMNDYLSKPIIIEDLSLALKNLESVKKSRRSNLD